MTSLVQHLRKGPCLLLDGAMGTMLMQRGLPSGTPPDLWNLERPDVVEQCHRAYALAGSQAVQSNTFGASPLRLAHFNLGPRCREINLRAVEIARRASAGYVIGDVGPSGLFFPPLGQASPQALHSSFCEQAQALDEAGVDGFHVETMTDLREARIALAAIRSVSERPVLVSLCFMRTRRGFYTPMGDAAEASLGQLASDGADAVGANCGLDSNQMRELGDSLKLPGARLVFQANAGQPELQDGALHYAQSPQAYAEDMAPLGHRLAALGGCCGTTPEFIASLACCLK
ncbi:methionine synthase I, cobalamin-binding domain-containing protein [bacterium CPR1]|nr:methionine synthase I, cobalamin-binding domain-containing protein [bacterium CPR1]